MEIPEQYTQRHFHIEEEGFSDNPIFDVRDAYMDISRGHFEGPDALQQAIAYVDQLNAEHAGYLASMKRSQA